MTPRKWFALIGAVLVVAIVPVAARAWWPEFANFVEDWQAWYGVMLAFAGLAYITGEQFEFSQSQARKRADEERAGLIRALYFEVYNRAARCALDTYTWLHKATKGKPIHVSQFRKFRPTDPIVFPTAGARLASLPADVLSPVTMFYFRLDAVRRDIDKDPEIDPNHIIADREVKLLARRFGETLKPALQALNALGEYLDDRAGDDRELTAAHADFIEKFAGEDLQTILAKLIKLPLP